MTIYLDVTAVAMAVVTVVAMAIIMVVIIKALPVEVTGHQVHLCRPFQLVQVALAAML
ncbi:MAG TPA: hypothetical protein PLB25_19885 [Rhodoferax sp.]|nr:hypothetical protein [Rhodoferax sp.]